MRLPLLACVVLSACGADDPVGITVTIAAMPGVQTVEVFVAKSASVGLSGPPDTASLAAKLFEVPNDRSGPSLIDANSGFLLVNDLPEAYVIETFAALGYDSNGTVIAAYQHPEQILVVPGKTEHWQLTLSAATDIIPGRMPESPEEFRARRWKRSDDTMPSCAIIEHGGERLAFGPVGDRDCDEHTVETDEEECAPWIHLADATAPTGFANATCGTREELVPGFPHACLASGNACSEKSGSTNDACIKLSQDFCVDSAMCECMPWDRACLAAKLAPVASRAGSFVKCHACQTSAMYDVNLQPLLGASPSTCNSVRVRELGPVGAPLGALIDRATFPSGELKVTSYTEQCTAQFEWKGTSLSNTPDIGFLSLDIDNSGVTKHVVVPLYIYYECGPTPTCDLYLADADPVRLCAEPPLPSACRGDAICGYAPYCGDKCCNPGEECVNGVCSCGANGSGCSIGQICAGTTQPGTVCGSTCCTPDTMTGECI